MTKPTQEQIKEFWEWCGFEYRHEEIVDASGCKVFLTSPYFNGVETEIPLIDLNDLFRYAVPKLNECGLKLRMLGQKRGKKTFFCSIGDNNTSHHYTENEDSTLALFWAIWEIIHEGGETPAVITKPRAS